LDASQGYIVLKLDERLSLVRQVPSLNPYKEVLWEDEGKGAEIALGIAFSPSALLLRVPIVEFVFAILRKTMITKYLLESYLWDNNVTYVKAS